MAGITQISENIKDFSSNRCCLVKNILDYDLCKYLSIQTELDILKAVKTNSNQVEGSREVYNSVGTKIANSIVLEKLKNKLELESIYSTYGFYRKYYKFQDLKKHIDRPECELSISICLDMHDKSQPWEIFFENKQQEITYSGKPEIGDGIIYMGMELPHWREKCQQKWVKQIFLHYTFNQELEFDKNIATGEDNDSRMLLNTLIKTLSENY